MQLANVEINTREGGLSEVIVNGVHLERCLAGFSYEHRAGEVPMLHVDLYTENAKIRAQTVSTLTPILIPDINEG